MWKHGIHWFLRLLPLVSVHDLMRPELGYSTFAADIHQSACTSSRIPKLDGALCVGMVIRYEGTGSGTVVARRRPFVPVFDIVCLDCCCEL